jgi:hypothetical protein
VRVLCVCVVCGVCVCVVCVVCVCVCVSVDVHTETQLEAYSSNRSSRVLIRGVCTYIPGTHTHTYIHIHIPAPAPPKVKEPSHIRFKGET